MKKFYFLIMCLLVFAQAFSQRTVSGKVTDDTGEGLPGVNVVIKGTTTGVTTDLDGNYSISVEDGTILVISYVGFETQEIEVGSRTTVDVTMGGATELDEVVVVAYGTQSRESLTGSISVIDSEQTENLTFSNPVKGLEGLAPGLRIIQADGRPGSDPIIRIRGFGSINADSQPLIVLDGVPYTGSLSNINPQDIESTTILKDASSTSLYGNKASNGVLLITTKKGSSRKTVVSLDTRIGVTQRAAKDYDVIDSPGKFYETYHSILANSEYYAQGANGTPIDAAAARQYASNNLVSELGNYNLYNVADNVLVDPATGLLNSSATLLVNDRWEDVLFRDRATFRSTNLSVSGGTKDLTYYFSIGSEVNEGYTVQSGFERTSARVKVESSKIMDFLTIGGDIAYANTFSQNVPATVNAAGVPQTFFVNSFAWTRNIAPIYPVFQYDRNWNPILNPNNPDGMEYDFGQPQVFGDGTTRGPRRYAVGEHPLAVIENTTETFKKDNFIGAFRLGIDLPLGIKFQYVMNLTKEYDRNVDFTAPGAGAFAQAQNGLLTVTRNNFTVFTNQQLLTWDKDFNNQSLDILIGHETYEEQFTTLGVDKRNLIGNQSPVLDNTAVYASASNYNERYVTEGYFSRFIYGMRDTYYFNLSGRYDASSVFHPDERWGAFWSAGASWIMSNESFMNFDFVDYAKLSANYGTTGNDRIFYSGTTSRNFVAYENQYEVDENNGELTQTLLYLGNPLITWEKAASLDVALEMNLFNNLRASIGYYRKESNDLLFNNPIPSSTGQATRPENFGSMVNSGVELELLYTPLKGEKFNLSFNWNGSTIKNELKSLPIDSVQVGNFRRVVGRSLFDYYMVRSAGVNADNGNAQYWTVNTSGESVITEDYSDAANNGRTFLGKEAIPDLFGGFGLNASYGNFSLGIQFAYQIGGYGIDNQYFGLLGLNDDRTNIPDYDETWTFDNPTASLPRVDPLAQDQYQLSDRWLVDLSYLSISNINFGYTFRGDALAALDKYRIGSIRLYGTVNNAFLLSSARQGYDPRLNSVGSSAPEYGANRTIALGLNITLD